MTTLSKFPFSVWERAHTKVQAELISAGPGLLRQQVSDFSTLQHIASHMEHGGSAGVGGVQQSTVAPGLWLQPSSPGSGGPCGGGRGVWELGSPDTFLLSSVRELCAEGPACSDGAGLISGLSDVCLV